MSSPISAKTVTATQSLIPGIVRSRSRVGWNGFTASVMRAVISAMLAASWSITCRCSSTRNAWCAVNRPVNATVSWAVFLRRLIRARPANVWGSVCPATRLSRIARPDTPMMSVATEDSLIPASCRTRSSRLTSRARSRVNVLRSRGQVP